jgi:ferredoxin
VAVLWLAGLVALVLLRGRLFCNLLCPAGAVLNLLSRRTALRIGIDEAACDGCGLCERVCKAGCIDSVRHAVDFPACVGCFDCLDVCPADAVRLERGWRRSSQGAGENVEDAGPDQGRRALLKVVALAPGALVGRAVAAGAAREGGTPRAPLPAVPVPGPIFGDTRVGGPPITPPGSHDRFHFTSHCTACQLCVAACPTQVLRPSLLAYAPDGLLQPRLVYRAAACAYDCNRCGQVCPTGAIEALPIPARHLVQVGRARFVKDDCVVVKKGKACGACAEHCPTKAITLVPWGPSSPLRVPEVNEELCIGCGSCEHPCPTRPLRAIYVEARATHGTAKVLTEAPLASPLPGADFPF